MSQPSGARYFGEVEQNLRDLQRNAAEATLPQLAKAAALLEDAFKGVKTAWFGGFALNLRGSDRTTNDLDLLVAVKVASDVRPILAPYNWALLNVWDLGGPQARIFVDIGERGQVVGVDIIVAGALLGNRETPDISKPGRCESIRPEIDTPRGGMVSVILIKDQFSGKLAAWKGRGKHKDYLDLLFLMDRYPNIVAEQSKLEDKKQREDIFAILLAGEGLEAGERFKRALSL